MLRKGITIRAFSGNPSFMGGGGFLQGVDDFTRCFERARMADFEGIQLFLEPKGFFSLESSLDIPRAIAQAARSAGITISSIEIAPFSFLFTSDDAAERERAHQVVTRSLQIASEMKVAGVLAIPGYVGLPWDPNTPPVRYDLAYERTLEALAELAPTAERLGTTIMIENIWNQFLLSPLEMRTLIDAVGSARVRVLFDVGNIIQFGYPEQWIEILGSRIQEIHLKDYRRAVGTIHGMVDLLEGDVNWPVVIAALQRSGYDGFLTAEVFPYTHAPDVIVERTAQAITAILRVGQEGEA